MASQSSIEIVPLLPEHRQSTINLLNRSFFLQEPLNAVLKFDIPDEPASWVNHVIDGALRDQCSFAVIDTTTSQKEVVGVILNGISDRVHKEETFVVSSKSLNFVLSLMEKVSNGHDLFELYKTDRLFHCNVINIDEKQRGQNLSARLIDRSLDQARQLGIQGAFVVCSSLFSRKAFLRHGFQIINEILYSEYAKERLTDMGVHDRCTLLGRQL